MAVSADVGAIVDSVVRPGRGIKGAVGRPVVSGILENKKIIM